jgi:trk system potassium uptake protein TrkA
MLNIVIVGAGDIGRYMASILSKAQHNVIVVDKIKERLEELSAQVDVATRVGSGTDWQLLDDLLELNPNFLIALTDKDDTNLVSCSIAKHLGYPSTIARVRDSRYLNRTRLDFGRIFDVDHFIGPELLVAHDMMRYVASHGSVFVDHFAHGAVQLRTMILPAKWKKGDKPLQELNLPQGTMVGLIKRTTKTEANRIIFPHGSDHLLPGDEVTFIGESEEIDELHHLLGIPQKEISSVVLIGGSIVAINLAKLLEKKGIHVRIIEKDYNRCVFLADILKKTMILHNDGTDLDFLRSEKVGQADLVAACTRHDDVNILAGMLAREAGAEDVVIVIQNTNHESILSNLKLGHVVSPRINAANRILSQILSGTVTSLVSLYENRAEVMEIVVSMESKVLGIPLSELGPLLPKDFLIAMIQNRGRIMVANGARIISPGDTVIVITDPKHITELEKIF